jgi:hypothetical protein
MATYPNSGSILDSHTRTALSTQIIIMVNNEPVGAVQSFQESQDRSIERVFEVGLDGTVELVPTKPAEIGLRVSRIVYDGLSITEAMARGFRNVQAQRIPFDIVVIDQYTGTADDAVITTYQNCWFESISKSYESGNFIITEDASIKVENISTLRGGDAVALSQGVGGSRQINSQIDSVELMADSGVRRGSLDFEGLISASFV